MAEVGRVATGGGGVDLEVGGVSILLTYEAGTNPCFPCSSTFHQSLLAELRRTRMSPFLMGISLPDLPLYEYSAFTRDGWGGGEGRLGENFVMGDIG